MTRSADDPTRREFIQETSALAAALALPLPRPIAGESLLFAAPPTDRVWIGFVGVGGQGTTHVENLLAIEGVELKAICDIVPEKVARAQTLTVAAGQPSPAGYPRGPTDFRRMCEEQELDLVFTATPWEWHVPIMLAAMEHGKHAATEVPAATTVEDCWRLVEAAEKHRKHCIMMENCCYDRLEMLGLNLARTEPRDALTASPDAPHRHPPQIPHQASARHGSCTDHRRG